MKNSSVPPKTTRPIPSVARDGLLRRRSTCRSEDHQTSHPRTRLPPCALSTQLDGSSRSLLALVRFFSHFLVSPPVLEHLCVEQAGHSLQSIVLRPPGVCP